MATLANEAGQTGLAVPGNNLYSRRFGLSSPWEHYYHPSDTAPQGRFECELDEMVVFGEIPNQISGTWYRMLIDPHFNPQPGTPFVDGDGNVCAFRIQGGKISMKIKYVETERWLLERKAGGRLFGRYRNPFDNHPCVRLANDSTGNTNIICWAGKILSLAERGLPYALDPDTLQTRGPDPYKLPFKTFSAHPKVDPHKNELVGWSYSAKGLSTRDICTFSIDSHGKMHNAFWYQQDKPGWPHDGWITDNWIILSNMPFTVNSDEVMKAGGDYWRFIPDQPSEMLISPRKSNLPNHPDWKPGEFRKYTMPHGLVIHTGNAWEEEGGILKLESHFASPNAPHPPNPADYKGPQGPPSGDWKRWTVDLSKPDGTALPPPETLLSGIFDFPIFDERLTGRKSRVVYLGQMTKPESERPDFDSVVRLDTKTGEKLIFSPAEYGRVAEPAYIPRGPNCEKGDGWLIFYADRLSASKGELIILDTRDFTKPVAIVQLPFLLRNQVHGNWVPNPHLEQPLPPLTANPVRDVEPTPYYSRLTKLP